jgi:predicted kinase
VTPLLIAFAGPPCAGKSTVAKELARTLNISRLSMDATRRRILPDAAHTREDRKAAYRAMHFAAELLLQNGVSAILDAPYGHSEDRVDLARVVEAGRARLCLVECRVSPETAARRLAQRGYDPDRPDLTEAIVFQAARDYPYTHAGLVLDLDKLQPEEALQRVCEYIQ